MSSSNQSKLFASPTDSGQANSSRTSPTSPLADRMRPQKLADVVGQAHLLAPGKPLREMIDTSVLVNAVFWGPAGSGKTTVARLMAASEEYHFIAKSAVMSGTREVKDIIEQAKQRWTSFKQKTVLFLDEIHRFNKTQQDAFLPAVEAGDITLLGATTENPSFSLNAALLSRLRVFVFEPLDSGNVKSLLERALQDDERGLGGLDLQVAEESLEALARAVAGDARRALSALELAASIVGESGEITTTHIEEALGESLRYDRAGEEHFNLISALHKSIRNSDADAAVYWAVRMIDAGEDPLYIARRLVRIASEDVGLADPRALGVSLSARDAYHFLGAPEGHLALIQAAVYLAMAPKSNRLYVAERDARKDVREHGALPAPKAIRNAPTRLMEKAGYGEGYVYAHDVKEGVADLQCLPDQLQGSRYYEPNEASGFEARLHERSKELARRLERYKERTEQES